MMMDSTMDNGLYHFKRLTIDSEDSSYDSDCEGTDGKCLTHKDVSRTTSDTLGQEFDEYVTSTIGIKDNRNLAGLDDNLYQTRVDFARKLGYSEEQLKIALGKLGASASQNELLAELIQLDCSNSSSTMSNSTSSHQNQHETVGSVCGVIGNQYSQKHQRVLSSNGLGNNLVTSTISLPIVLRHIVIDGSNVAMSHGNNQIFSCRGILMAVDYFKARGHKDITVFVPSYRKEIRKPDDSIADREILLDLEKEGTLVFTPSRTVGNKRLVCYDDRYVIKLAVETEGIVVSNDNYRDLANESPEFKKVIAEKMLMYSFVNDRFMPPEDPLGRNGPSLDQFLSKTPLKSSPPCPYGRKCTYGTKCKYFHPIVRESVSDNLRKQAALKASQSLPLSTKQQIPITRTRSAIPLQQQNQLTSLIRGGAQSSMATTNPSHHYPQTQQVQSSSSNHQPNTHRKLQRQLSINPISDPRVAFNPTLSNNNLINSGAMLNHQISANGISCSSSTSICSSTSSTYLSPFPNHPGLGEVWSPPSTLVNPSMSNINNPNTNTFDENRKRIYFHLTAIFPKDQVLHVMNLYPDENDAQVMCRHIIKHFN